MNTKSIQVRLTIWYTALIVSASVAFGAYTYVSMERRLFEEMQGMLVRRIEHLREDVLPGLSTFVPVVLAEKIEEVYSPEENERFIRISKADGTVLYVSGKPQEQTFDPSLIPVNRNYTDTPTEVMRGLRESQHLLLVGYKSRTNGDEYVLEMGTSITPVIIALHKLVLTLLIGLPIVGGIAIVGGAVLVRRALQPVEAMRASAEKISFSNLRQRLPATPTGDAIEHLSETLNQMLGRLDQAYQQASRFSADASHELRTPLTIIRSELEAMLHSEGSTEIQRERLGSILEESERLSNIVESLFSLARLDAGEAKSVHEVFDLAALAELTLEQMQLLAVVKRLSVTVEANGPIYVAGDSSRMKQMIVNLLDNSIKYTMAGGAISLSVHTEGAKAVLTVGDNGIGIDPESLPHIFERFYRADKVRSREVQGAGLGLSIVNSICQAHGGTVVPQSEEGIGTAIIVALPLAVKPI